MSQSAPFLEGKNPKEQEKALAEFMEIMLLARQSSQKRAKFLIKELVEKTGIPKERVKEYLFYGFNGSYTAKKIRNRDKINLNRPF